MNIIPLHTSHPEPGTTKFAGRMDPETARHIAEEYWDVLSIEPCTDSSGEYHAVRTRGGYSGMVGIIDEHPAVLQKQDDGSRALIQLAIER